MSFGNEVLAIFMGDVFASVLVVALYAGIQWFLRATDVTVSYNWEWKGTDFHPRFDVRNRSASKTYWLANLAYTRNQGQQAVWLDNKSLWGKELRPGCISFLNEVAPVPGVTSIPQCTEMEISLRLQNGRQFWLKGQGPGQLHAGRIQGIAFWLRAKIERAAIPLE